MVISSDLQTNHSLYPMSLLFMEEGGGETNSRLIITRVTLCYVPLHA